MQSNNNKQELNTEMDAKDIAWELFKKSGNVNYYRLYSDLKKEEQ